MTVVTTSCRLTRKDVMGKWQQESGDTIIINANDSFILIKKNNIQSRSKENISGHWKLSQKSIHFYFEDSLQHFGGGCSAYWYMWTKGSKKKLVRPGTCYSPTNRFVSARKIE
ncbi:MAG: hypothetical protein QM791_13830 [Ferruginibacter sp.]